MTHPTDNEADGVAYAFSTAETCSDDLAMRVRAFTDSLKLGTDGKETR